MSGVAQLTFWMLAYFPVVTPLIFKPVIFLEEVLLSVPSIETRVPEPSLGVTRIAYNFSAFLLIVGPFRNMLCAPIPFLPSCCLKRTDKAKKNRERVGWLQHSACKKKLI